MPPEFGMWNAECPIPSSEFRIDLSFLIRCQAQIGPNNFARAAVT